MEWTVFSPHRRKFGNGIRDGAGVYDTPSAEKMTNRRKKRVNSIFTRFFFWNNFSLYGYCILLEHSAYAPVPFSNQTAWAMPGIGILCCTRVGEWREPVATNKMRLSLPCFSWFKIRLHSTPALHPHPEPPQETS